MKATYLDHMGSDDRVCDAARISFAKQASQYTREQNEKLITYLAKHNHWSPFAHVQLTYHIKAPIFVARQLVKHQVGLVYNEESRRYIGDEPEFYIPDEWRMKADNKKQGSSDATLDDFKRDYYTRYMRDVQSEVNELYLALLEDDVAPEMARMVLPLNTYTQWVWTGSLYAFARVCKLRLDPHAQAETRMIAQQISDQIPGELQYSWKALMNV